jgi:hypothetical protein
MNREHWPRTAASWRMIALMAFAVCVALCAGVVFLLVIRTVPIADDLCRASLFENSYYVGPPFMHWAGPHFLQRPGIFQYTGLTYLNWSGRWASTGVETLLLSTTPLPGAYPWLLFMLIAIRCLLLYLTIRLLVADARHTLYLSAVIASVCWATMPSPRDGVFWITGTVENQVPLTLGALLFALVVSQRPTAAKQSTRLSTIAASVMGFVISAFHELAGGVLVLALSAITATAFVSKSPRRKVWLTVWSTSALGFLVVFAAPGNFNRAATELPAVPYRGNYLIVIKASLEAIRSYVLPWCLDFKHWLLAVLLWFDPQVASLRNRLSGWSSFGAAIGFLVVWIFLIMIAIAAAAWNVGQLPAGRTMNLIYGIFLTGWIVLAFLVARPHPVFAFHPVHRAVTLSAALVLLAALVATSDNTYQNMGYIVRGSARAWDAELIHSYMLVKSAGRNADVILPRLSERAVSYSQNGIRQDPNFWANRCLSQYFGVASVRNAGIISK